MNDIKLIDLVYIEKNFINDYACELLIQEFDNSKKYFTESSRNFKCGDRKKSGGLMTSLKPETESFMVAHYYTKKIIKKYIDYLNNFNCFFTDYLLKGLKYSHNFRIIKYEKEDFFHDHIDYEIDQNTFASCTLNLNEDYIGGEFRFFNGRNLIELKKGDVMIFPASPFFVHGVNKIIEGKRYSINSFILPKPYNNDKINEKFYYLG